MFVVALGHDGVHARGGGFGLPEEIEGKGRGEVIVGRFFEFQLAAEVRGGTLFLSHFQEKAPAQVVEEGRFFVEREGHVHGFQGGFVVLLLAIYQGAQHIEAAILGIEGLCAIQCRLGFVIAAELDELLRSL